MGKQYCYSSRGEHWWKKVHNSWVDVESAWKNTTVLYFAAGCDFFLSNYLFHLTGLFVIQPSCSYSLPPSQPKASCFICSTIISHLCFCAHAITDNILLLSHKEWSPLVLIIIYASHSHHIFLFHLFWDLRGQFATYHSVDLFSVPDSWVPVCQHDAILPFVSVQRKRECVRENVCVCVCVCVCVYVCYLSALSLTHFCGPDWN